MFINRLVFIVTVNRQRPEKGKRTCVPIAERRNNKSLVIAALMERTIRHRFCSLPKIQQHLSRFIVCRSDYLSFSVEIPQSVLFSRITLRSYNFSRRIFRLVYAARTRETTICSIHSRGSFHEHVEDRENEGKREEAANCLYIIVKREHKLKRLTVSRLRIIP